MFLYRTRENIKILQLVRKVIVKTFVWTVLLRKLFQIEVIFQKSKAASFLRRYAAPGQKYHSLPLPQCIVSRIHHGVMALMFMQIYCHGG